MLEHHICCSLFILSHICFQWSLENLTRFLYFNGISQRKLIFNSFMVSSRMLTLSVRDVTAQFMLNWYILCYTHARIAWVYLGCPLKCDMWNYSHAFASQSRYDNMTFKWSISIFYLSDDGPTKLLMKFTTQTIRLHIEFEMEHRILILNSMTVPHFRVNFIQMNSYTKKMESSFRI